MSKRSSLKEALARRASVEGAPRNRSGSSVALILHADRGEGIGGGVFNLGSLDLDALTLIFDNLFSATYDDVFSI